MVVRRAATAVLLAAAAAVPPAAFGSPVRINEHLTAADLDSWRKTAQDTLQAGPELRSLSDADHALRILTNLDAGAEEFGHIWCGAAAVGMHGGQGLSSIYHGIQVAEALGCGIPDSLSTVARDLVAQGLYGTKLEGLYYAALVSQKKGSPPLDLVKRVAVLVESSGLVAGDDTPDSLPTQDNAYPAAELLALLAELAPADSAARADAAHALANIASLLPSSAATAASDALLLHPLTSTPAAAAATAPALERGGAALLRAAAAQLLSLRRCGGDAAAAWRVHAALRALAARADAPLAVAFAPPSVSAGALRSGGGGAAAGLSVRTLLGAEPSDVAGIVVRSLRPHGTKAGEENLLGGPVVAAAAAASGTGVWTAKGLESVAPGRYIAEVSIARGDGAQEETVSAPLVVTGAASVAAVRFAVNGEDVRGGRAKAGARDRLSVAFALEGDVAAPQQCSVRLRHAASGLSTYYSAQRSGGGARPGEYAATVDLSKEAAQLQHRSGDYDLALLAPWAVLSVGWPMPIGDMVLPAGVEVPVGAVHMEFEQPKPQEWPLYVRTLLHESDVTLVALPEKHHTFREPDRRAPAPLGILFAALVCAPLALFVLALRRLGVRPERPSGGVWGVAYQACIGAVLALFVLYWASLTMVVALQALLPLVAVTAFVGRKALVGLDAPRESPQE
ncbi:Oligosaccharyltransferase subunit Ribophorin II-domain-containing protein [Tribonema minus]|uniref:Ribophorin II n=1 Tax=Tribonema minus TaxID=303371 RepID=A0A835Z9H4_9STRA|nr:Oligosaccharyltransferase subunit Ribophorin II-domain-containing protein [Tribonema minus]